MRITRYLWINNLPDRVSEQDIRDVLQSHGKIQSVRIHEHDGNNGAVVAFVDTKSATRAMESTVRLKKVHLSLQYCESSGIPGSNSADQLSTSLDYTQISNNNNNNSMLQTDESCHQKSRSISTVSDSSSLFHESEHKEHSQTCLPHSGTPKHLSKDIDSNHMNAISPHFINEHRGLKISHLPLRSSDTNLREGLFHEYKKHGKITSVFVRGQGEERICIITFKRSEDAERALASSKGKVFFGTLISVVPHEGLDTEDPDLCPPEHALDEYHPKATKTLFVGNLCSGTITQDELRRTFRVYGEIIEIDIKVQANQPGTSYAFIQYGDIKSVVRALNNQDSIRVCGKAVKLGFGKSQPTNVIWLDNLASTINEPYLTRQFGRYGQLTHVVLDRKSLRALLYFDSVEMAQRAFNETRNRAIIGRKVQIDYAGYECQVAFMRKLGKHDSFGQVYENYRERLQELLSLWPSYSGVLPFLSDRQRYFGDNQRDGQSFHAGNTKFSYRRSNCLRSSPDRLLKHDQPPNKIKNANSVSPHNRLHQTVHSSALGPSSDRRRNYSVTSPNDSSVSSNWGSLHTTRNQHNRGSFEKVLDSASQLPEEKANRTFYKKRLRNDDVNYSKSKQHNRFVSHGDVKSSSDVRPHFDYSNCRGRSQFLDEADDISSGSFSSGFTAEDSPFETSPVKRHSSGSSERTGPLCKTASQREVVTSMNKRSDVDPGTRQKTHKSNRSEMFPSDEAYSHFATKKTIPKPRVNSSPRTQVPSRLSVGRTHSTSTSFSRTHSTEKNCNMPVVRKHESRERSDEHVSQKYIKPNSSQRRACRPTDLDDPNSNYSASKSKRALFSSTSNITKGSDYVSARPGTSMVSPISSDDLNYNKVDDPYSSTRASEENSNVAGKSHDTLTKLEMERAKLLRELSLLNNEVIGGNKSKNNNFTSSLDNRINRKRAPSNIVASNDMSSPKSKRLDPETKCNISMMENSVYSNDHVSTSPVRSRKLSSPDSFPCKTIQSPSIHNSPQASYSTVDDIRGRILPLDVYRGNIRNVTEFLPPASNAHTTPPANNTDGLNIHIPSKQVSISSRVPPNINSVPATCFSVSINRQPALMTSSPRLLLPPEPTSPLVHISPPSSPLVPESSFISTPNLLSTSSSNSTSGSKILSTTGSGSRDPRLALHHNQSHDIPPPPPPPEAFKLPLWIDTSAHQEIPVSNGINNPISKSQSPIPSKSSVQACDVTHDVSVQDFSTCSLDERIRLLDVQLMKSEKARPAVDYSKFRIRRKVESSNTPQITSNMNTTQSGSSISSPSLSINSVFATSTRAEHTILENVSSLTATVVSFPTTCLVVTSPILSNSSSLSLIKPADTSEFVKSMLSSSKPSPTPCSDSAVNMLSEAIDPCNRRLTSSPSSVSSFLNRLPRSSVSSNPCSVGVIQPTVSSLSNKPTNSLNRFQTNACNIEHSSLAGAQPVGVATRMPSVNLSHCAVESRYSEERSLTGHSQISKSILKKEHSEDFETIQSMNDASEIVNNLEIHKSGNTASNILPRNSTSNKSPLPEPSGGSSAKTNYKTFTNSQRAFIPEERESGREDSLVANKCKTFPLPDSLESKPTVIKRNLKHDVPRPGLDNSVFQNSWRNPAKIDSSKKLLQVSNTSPVSSKKKSFPLKDIKPILSVSNTVSKSMSDNSNDNKTKVKRLSSKNNHTKKKLDSLTERSVHIALEASSSGSKSKTSEDNQITNNLNSPKEPDKKCSVSTNRRKRRVKISKKRTVDSEESDWEPGSNVSVSHPQTDLQDSDSVFESHYESMYDKIKRRANKTATKNTDPKSKPSALNHLIKARGRPTKKTDLHKSPVDSDTDECLSDNSSYQSDDISVPRTKRPEKCNTILVDGSPKSNKTKIHTNAIQPKSTHDSSSVTSLIKRKKRLHSNTVSEEISNKNKCRKNRISDLRHPSIDLKRKQTIFDSDFTESNNVSNISENRRKKIQRSRNLHEHLLNVKNTNIATSSLKNNPAKSKLKKTGVQKQGLDPSLLKGRKLNPVVESTHRSLVRRVFASTDSSSLSSSVVSDASDNELGSSLHKERSYKGSDSPLSCSKLSNCESRSSHASRSCSPDDLGVDEAIRHTFGAFAAPFSTSTVGIKSEFSRNPAAVTTTQDKLLTGSSHTKLSPDFDDLKPTPPTLPMTDSSCSTDQQSSSGTASKFQTRDTSDWNIFTSLAKQSTPKKDEKSESNEHQDLSPNLEATKSNVTLGKMDTNVNDLVEEIEDELPSLEKHDNDDESCTLDESSILLYDSGSLNNNTNSLQDYRDNDLPPPVVPALDPQLSYSEAIAAPTETTSDIIEEVVYDGLEVPNTEEPTLLVNETKNDNSLDLMESSHGPMVESSISNPSENIMLQTSEVIDLPDPDIAVSPKLTSHSSPSATLAHAVTPITLQSTILTSVAMLTTSRPELQTVGPSMLVTIPRSVASANFASSNLTFLAGVDTPSSQSRPFISPNGNSTQQRHIALILPATSMPFANATVSSVSTTVPSAITAVPISNAEPVDTSVTYSSSSMPNSCSAEVQQSHTTISKVTLLSGTRPLSSGACVTSFSASSSIDSSGTVTSSHVGLPSTSQSVANVAFDPADYTSYVQRVIERVKQEKDEEILHQREKVKRPKKSAVTISSCVVTIPNLTALTTNTNSHISSSVVTLPTIAPILSIPGVNVCPKPPLSSSIEEDNSTPALSNHIPFVSQDHIMTSSCSNDTKCAPKPSPPNYNLNDSLDSTVSHATKGETADVVSNENHSLLVRLPDNDESVVRDTVDDTIDAVVNGEYDETEYVQKLIRGTFVYTTCHNRSLSNSLSSPGPHSDTLTHILPTTEESSATKSDYIQTSQTEQMCSSSKSVFDFGLHPITSTAMVKNASDSVSSESLSPGVLTPMHVLTFVAAGAATASQRSCTPTAISPNLPGQSLPNLSAAANQFVANITMSATSSSSNCLESFDNRTQLAVYTAVPEGQSTTTSTVTQIENFAAQLANNPLTSYFYSLLTQKQLSPSLSPSVSSRDSIGPRSVESLTVSLGSSSALKGLTIPTATVGEDTADYLAAATTMAAMAAMAGPKQEVSSYNQNSVSTSSYTDPKTSLTESQSSQNWNGEQMLMQDYAVIWRGRLSLKNEEVYVQMHYVNGNQELLKSCMSVIAENQTVTNTSSLGSCLNNDVTGSICQPLKIVQRMRLEPSQLEGVQRKLRQINDFCMCLTLAATPPLTPESALISEQSRMNRVLCDGFIKYMLEKCAAGIINVCHPCTQQNLFVIHIFPPCEFSRYQLQACAPSLANSLNQNSIPHVLTVITTV